MFSYLKGFTIAFPQSFSSQQTPAMASKVYGKQYDLLKRYKSFLICSFLIFSHHVLGQTKDHVGQSQSGFGGLLSFCLPSFMTGLG